jgi:hypothetical protein
MQLNRENPPLNSDMSMLVERIKATMQSNAEATGQTSTDPTADGVRTDFSLYGVTRH